MNEIIFSSMSYIESNIKLDISKITNNDQVEKVIIKYYSINNDLIERLNSCKKLTQVWFIGCEINENIILKDVLYLKIDRCKIINHNLFCSNLKKLEISNMEEININDINHLNLNYLKIDNTIVYNIKNIENLKELEYLYLQEININEKIDLNQFFKIKLINFDGSKTSNLVDYINTCKSKNIKFSFKKSNLKVS